jgi:hypothetical protein
MEKGFNDYLFEYYHDGSWWGFKVRAWSPEDARERANKLPHAKYIGESVVSIPAEFGLLGRMVCWARNLLLK